jgi:hypothetical protein
MTDYLLADPIARLHLLILPLKINGMENFGLLNIKETVSFKQLALLKVGIICWKTIVE